MTGIFKVVRSIKRARIHRLWQNKPFLQANVELLEEDFPGRMTPRMEALIRQTYVIFGEYKELVTNLNDDFVSAVLDCRDPGHLADFIAQNINLRHGWRAGAEDLFSGCFPVFNFARLAERPGS